MAFKQDKAARVAAAKKLHSGGARSTGLANLDPMDIIGVGLDVAKLIPGAEQIAGGIDTGLDMVKSVAPDALGEEAEPAEAAAAEEDGFSAFKRKREKEIQEANADAAMDGLTRKKFGK